LYTSTPEAVAVGEIEETVSEDELMLVLVRGDVIGDVLEEPSEVSGRVVVKANVLLDVVSVDVAVEDRVIDREDELVRLQVPTQYAYPVSICGHVGGSTAGFQSRNVSKDMLNRAATKIQ